MAKRTRFVRRVPLSSSSPRHKNPLDPPKLPTMPRMPGLPRFPGFPTFAALQPVQSPKRVRQVVHGSADSQSAPQPPWWEGSDIEWLVYWWLTAHGIDFEYTPTLPGIPHGDVRPNKPDFLVKDRTPPLVVEVQGDYFHYSTTRLRSVALARKQAYYAMGFRDVVYVRGMDLTASLNDTMRSALQGVQMFKD